jgi:hypothetical protein
MDVRIVFESMFGNTRAVAEAIAAGVRAADDRATVEVVPASEATGGKLDHVDLLVVGAPTHMMRTSSARTRRMAAQMAEKPPAKGGAPINLEPGATGAGVREWLDALPPAPAHAAVAAVFDTRLGHSWSGRAGRSIARRLRHHGYPVTDRRSFIVGDMQGPLLDHELDRARSWGPDLLRVVPA